MTNTIKGFLQGQEASTVRDIATHGVQSGAIGELIYTADVVDFFNRYYSDIEAVVTEYLEGITGMQYYDLLNYELMRDLENYANVFFEEEDTYLDITLDLAEQLAEEDNEDWNELTEDEQQEISLDYMDDVEIDIQDVDKVQFVNLAVDIVAQELAEERGGHLRPCRRHTETHREA